MSDEISLNGLIANIIEWKDRLINNSAKSWEEMTAQRWIRIVIIIGAYMLIRPYLLAHAERSRKARAEKEAEALGLDSGAEVSANELRGGGGSASASAVDKTTGKETANKGTKRKGTK